MGRRVLVGWLLHRFGGATRKRRDSAPLRSTAGTRTRLPPASYARPTTPHQLKPKVHSAFKYSAARGGVSLFLVFGVSDKINRKSLRDLRVEFDGNKVRCGEDRRNWLEGFDTREPVSVFAGTPAACVRFVLEWLQREWTRPIDLHEWMGENLLHQGQLYDLQWRHRRYVMPDAGRCLSYSNIGSCYDNNDNIGPPHRVTRVHPIPKR